jgi:hypothetical protein
VKPRLVLIALGAIAAISLMLTPSFSASVLTKFKAKKLFYTKGQSDSRYLTPSQGDSRYLTPGAGDARYLTPGSGDARYLTPGTGDARYLPDNGQIRINASPMTWQKISGAPGIDTLGQNPSIGGTSFGGSSGALSDVPVAIEPTMPTVLVGRPLTFVGVNVCYGTDQTTLDTVRINVTTNSNGSGNTNSPLIDGTDRTDDACRDYTLSTPHLLAPGDDVSLELAVDYSSNAQFFFAGRATFVFQL